jgi:hypothetical protein
LWIEMSQFDEEEWETIQWEYIDKEESLIDEINSLLISVEDDVAIAQEAFAEKHNFSLEQ